MIPRILYFVIQKNRCSSTAVQYSRLEAFVLSSEMRIGTAAIPEHQVRAALLGVRAGITRRIAADRRVENIIGCLASHVPARKKKSACYGSSYRRVTPCRMKMNIGCVVWCVHIIPGPQHLHPPRFVVALAPADRVAVGMHRLEDGLESLLGLDGVIDHSSEHLYLTTMMIIITVSVVFVFCIAGFQFQ